VRGRAAGTIKNGRRGAVVCAALLVAGALNAQDAPARTVTVKLAADRSIENIAEWKIAASRLLDDVFQTFQEQFGIRLVLGDIVTWRPRPVRRPLGEVLGELRKIVTPGKCDIVLGVVIPEHISSVSLGIASYPFGYILVKNLASREAMIYTLLHEVCHVFGAVDLREKGSIMGIEAPGFGIDTFTARAVRLHKDRTFGGPAYPLPKANFAEAAALFSDRARLGFAEPEVHLVLTLLFTEMNDLDSAAQACAEALHEDPGFIGLHVLLGNILLKQGSADQAVDEYRKALELQPGEAGIHFNLGLALSQRGSLGEAKSEFEQALKIHSGYAQARRALDRVIQAGSLSARLDLRFEPAGITSPGIK
jgi:tetratricopeptide (TPR) repeat protein